MVHYIVFFLPSVILPTSIWTKWQEFWRLKMHLVPNGLLFYRFLVLVIMFINTLLNNVSPKLYFTTILSPERMNLLSFFPNFLSYFIIQMIKVLLEKLIGKSSQEKGNIWLHLSKFLPFLTFDIVSLSCIHFGP